MRTIRPRKSISVWMISIGIIMALSPPLFAQDLANIKDAKPVTLHGSLGANLIFYGVDGIAARQDPFTYGFNANATLSLYSISMPFSFTWYNNNKSNFSQPFNQFGISPTYKWITGHFGYRSLNFSEFTLNGQTFLGAGVEMTPGKFRFGAMYGKFNKNSEYDPYMADSLPKFTRKGWAMKIGYGTSENFVDFSMLRIGDNTDNYIKPNDTLIIPTPEQNMAYGITSKISISKKLFFSIDGSLSFYTTDRKAQRLSTIDDKLLAFSDNFMTINQTSEHYAAFKSALTYKFTDKISTGIEYRRIAPGYQSMGAYFFNNDIENITINQTYVFLKDKINAKGSLGLQHDNLDKSKKATSKRTIGSLNLSYNINQNWGIDASFSNFTTNQKAGRLPIIDSLRLYQTNRTISITPRFMKVTEKKSHVVLLNYNFMKLDDKNKKTQNQTETNTNIIYLNYVLGFIPQKLNITLGLNYTGLKNNLYKNTMKGINAGISKTLAQDNLSIGWNNSFLLNKVNSDNGTIFNTSLTASLRFAKKHSINLNMYFIRNSFGEKAATPSYNEYRGDFSYVFTF
jgi:hypothetical protein